MLYILLPVFNEEAHIRQLIADIDGVLGNQPHEIVVVNDGSLDQTAQIIERLENPHVTVLSHNINLSIGAVYSTGINYITQKSADDDVMVLMESDLTSPASMIKNLAGGISENGHDIAIASRYLDKGGYESFPVLRTSLSLGANSLMRYFFPINNVRDYTIFLRGYRVGLLKKVSAFFGATNLLQSKGFVSNAELLIKCALFTNKIQEIPFLYNYAKKKNPSKLRIIGTVLEYFSFIFYMREIINKVKLRRSRALANEALQTKKEIPTEFVR